MTHSNRYLKFRTACAIVLFTIVGMACTERFWLAQAADATLKISDPVFEQQVKPFLKQNCVRCHNEENSMAGVRVDSLDAGLTEEKHIRQWESMRGRIAKGTMPPKGQPQPTSAERQPIVDWINKNLEIARLRPSPKNGMVRRLTVAQYRNTLKELLHLEDDLTEALPPDAVSKTAS